MSQNHESNTHYKLSDLLSKEDVIDEYVIIDAKTARALLTKIFARKFSDQMRIRISNTVSDRLLLDTKKKPRHALDINLFDILVVHLQAIADNRSTESALRRVILEEVQQAIAKPDEPSLLVSKSNDMVWWRDDKPNPKSDMKVSA